MSSDHTQFERRAGQRFEYHLPIAVRVPGREGEGVGFTQNLSSKGALFQTDFALHEAEAVEFTVVMPSEITLGENMRVRCRGHVLRSEQSGSGLTVAVHFAGYEFLPDEENRPRASNSHCRRRAVRAASRTLGEYVLDAASGVGRRWSSALQEATKRRLPHSPISKNRSVRAEFTVA